MLNNNSRRVIFCGAGASKSRILQDVFGDITSTEINQTRDGQTAWVVEMRDPAPYPCAMVRPIVDGTLVWVVDDDAAQGILTSTKSFCDK